MKYTIYIFLNVKTWIFRVQKYKIDVDDDDLITRRLTELTMIYVTTTTTMMLKIQRRWSWRWLYLTTSTPTILTLFLLVMIDPQKWTECQFLKLPTFFSLLQSATFKSSLTHANDDDDHYDLIKTITDGDHQMAKVAAIKLIVTARQRCWQCSYHDNVGNDPDENVTWL